MSVTQRRVSHQLPHMNFTFAGIPSRVVFGAGSLRDLNRELDALGAQRALVLSTPGRNELGQTISDEISGRSVGLYPHASMHVCIERVHDARQEASHRAADCLVAAGGGSTTGLAKAIALQLRLPILSIPTTYAGSEMTSIYGITEKGTKRTGKDPRILPRTVIYDPQLTVDLPLGVSVTSGMNAIAHAAEGLYAQNRNPLMELAAQEGIAAVSRAIPRLSRDCHDLTARTNALYGAWLCGTVLGNTGMAVHHKLCHTLGGTFNLPHAEVHTVILPHALAFNASAAPNAMRKIATAIESESAPRGIYDLARANGAPVSLEAIGMRHRDLARAADL
ncbi:MAG: maleylacetate reductase, partial [Nitrosospira sp.]|nr:maleylacetate reductase [Nitrosospira sp.]